VIFDKLKCLFSTPRYPRAPTILKLITPAGFWPRGGTLAVPRRVKGERSGNCFGGQKKS